MPLSPPASTSVASGPYRIGPPNHVRIVAPIALPTTTSAIVRCPTARSSIQPPSSSANMLKAQWSTLKCTTCCVASRHQSPSRTRSIDAAPECSMSLSDSANPNVATCHTNTAVQIAATTAVTHGTMSSSSLRSLAE